MEICNQVALGQAKTRDWIWKIWGHNPDKKIVEITYLLDNKEDRQKRLISDVTITSVDNCDDDRKADVKQITITGNQFV